MSAASASARTSRGPRRGSSATGGPARGSSGPSWRDTGPWPRTTRRARASTASGGTRRCTAPSSGSACASEAFRFPPGEPAAGPADGSPWRRRLSVLGLQFALVVPDERADLVRHIEQPAPLLLVERHGEAA